MTGIDAEWTTYFAWQSGDVDSGRLAFKDVSEHLKVRVSSSDHGMLELESGYVGLRCQLWTDLKR